MLAVAVMVGTATTGLAGSAGRSGATPAPTTATSAGWTPLTAPLLAADQNGAYEGLSCASDGSCMAVDGSGRTALYRDGQWSVSPAVIPGVANAIDSPLPTVENLGCASASVCVAVGSSGEAWLWDGQSWRAAPGPTADGDVRVSCPVMQPAQPVCLVALGNTLARYSGADSWGVLGPIEAAPQPGPALFAFACATSTSCLVIDPLQGSSLWDGQSWSAMAPIAGLSAQSAGAVNVSCAPTGTCLAEGNSTASWRFQPGAGWSAPTPVSGNVGGLYVGLDCVSDQLCLRELNGDAGSSIDELQVAGNGRATEAPISPAPPEANSDAAISCAAVCAVLTADGRLATWRPPVAVTSVTPGSGSAAGAVAYRHAGLPLPPPLTVTGEGFRFVDQVMFGTSAGTDVDVVSDSKLRVQPPPGATGVTDVRVVGPPGLSPPTPADHYTYRPAGTGLRLRPPASIKGAIDGPTTIHASLDVSGDPIAKAELSWAASGLVNEAAEVGPLGPGLHPLSVVAGPVAYATIPHTPHLGRRATLCVQSDSVAAPPACTTAAMDISRHGSGWPWWGIALIAAGALAVLVVGTTAVVRLRRL